MPTTRGDNNVQTGAAKIAGIHHSLWGGFPHCRDVLNGFSIVPYRIAGEPVHRKTRVLLDGYAQTTAYRIYLDAANIDPTRSDGRPLPRVPHSTDSSHKSVRRLQLIPRFTN